MRSDLSTGWRAIDAHVHVWDPARVPLEWLTDEHAPIARAFAPEDVAPLLQAANVGEAILVQSACLDADTDVMLEHAARHEWIAAVVGWVALADSTRAAERLDELATESKLRGIRHLVHDEPDPHWILRPAVLESIRLLEERRLVLEIPAVFPRHLGDIPELARAFPRLTIVIDHLGKPPLGGDLGAWAHQLDAAAEHPNVAAKLSGLNTATERRDWGADDLVPCVDAALSAFGASRLLCGSDWPVALLNGDYARVWKETRTAIARVAPDDAELLLAGTAERLYGLRDRGTAPLAHSTEVRHGID